MTVTIEPLPQIMVAPNGARRTKADHPALPMTIGEIVATAKACHRAGAGAIHAHVRDGTGNHVLDAGLYRELIAELEQTVPAMGVQITTEAVGRYSPEEQRNVVYDVRPRAVSVALKEMIPGSGTNAAREFYHRTRDDAVAVQHILYEPAEITRLEGFVLGSVIPAGHLQVLFVLGRYAKDQESDPSDLQPFLQTLANSSISDADWAVCAFGKGETACLARALEYGGKVRVGFENSLWNADGSLARDNAERVARIAELAVQAGTS